MSLKEDKSCYASSVQRDTLIYLSGINEIRENFFLTGGTALSVFYLNHRVSDDLDLFSNKKVDLSRIDFNLVRELKDNINKTNSTEFYLSYIINNTKVDFAIDEVSNNLPREKYYFDDKAYIAIDNINNILSNKLCVLVSRTEIKDYIDFFYLMNNADANFKNIYEDAKLKDSIFEDYPTVGYQVEQGFNYSIRNKILFPVLKKSFNEKDYINFYKKITEDIYSFGKFYLH
jgi:predicted nucleotidyltransferase component of viral defense system